MINWVLPYMPRWPWAQLALPSSSSLQVLSFFQERMKSSPLKSSRRRLASCNISGHDDKEEPVMADELYIPSICCRCGKSEGAFPWELSVSRSRSYYVAKRTVTYEFVVGACEPCLRVLQEAKATTQLATIIAYIGSIPLGIMLSKLLVPEWELMNFTQENSLIWLGALLLILVFGTILSMVMKRVIEELYDTRLVTISSKSLKPRFSNPEFQRQFRARNPRISD